MYFIPAGHSEDSTGLRIYLIRHAESMTNIIPRNSLIDIETIPKDPSLSPTGHKQAYQLAEFIKHHSQLSKISVILTQLLYCSPMYRSLLTAQYLQQALELEPEIWPDIFEVKGSRVLNTPNPGLKRSEIETEFPGFLIPEECTESGWFFKDSIESEEEAWERAGRVVNRLMDMSHNPNFEGKSIAIIGHGLFFDYLLGRICERTIKGRML